MFGWPFSILSCFNYNLVVARIWFIMFLLVFFVLFCIITAGLAPAHISSMLSLPAPPHPSRSQTTPPPSGTPGSNANQTKKTCPYCYQQLSWHALSRHIRDMHKARPALVDCKFCGKMFRNKNSLGCHMWRFHKSTRTDTPASATSVKDESAAMAAGKDEDMMAAMAAEETDQ
jgi:hypothetical protein